MKLLFASDSFKGTLSSEKTVELLTKAAHEVFGPCETFGVPVADGGEGTTDAVVLARKGDRVYTEVHGPLMETVRAYYGKLGGNEAVLEMAQASGLPMVPEELRNPLNTTTFGTGELVLAAINAGYTNLSIAIGGSATNDGGMGFANALGVRFYDADGNMLEGKGSDLEKVAHIDASGIPENVKNANFTVMCDVTNPLCGKDGATYTFGKQKGGTPEILDRLEKGMENYRSVIIREFGIDPNETPGTGAAGGLGAALKIVFNAEMKSVIETVLDLIDFDGAELFWQSHAGRRRQGQEIRHSRGRAVRRPRKRLRRHLRARHRLDHDDRRRPDAALGSARPRRGPLLQRRRPPLPYGPRGNADEIKYFYTLLTSGVL